MLDMDDAELDALMQLVGDAYDDRRGIPGDEDPLVLAVIEKVVTEVRARGISMSIYREETLRPIVDRVDAALAAQAPPRP